MAKITLVSPQGKAVYPALLRPDTKFDPLGAYKADIRIPLQEAKDFMKALSKPFKEYIGKAPHVKDNTMWKFDLDDDGNETGSVTFKFRVKNKEKKDGSIWDRKPRLFDSSNTPLAPTVNPWGGSTLAVAVEVYCWKAGAKTGVSLQPLAVQVIDLITGNDGGSGDSYGFGETEGFTAPKNDTPFDDEDTVETDIDDEEDY